KAVQAKDFVIAYDHSGSMSGKKIQQAREALTYVLNNLNPDDRFNVVSYNDSVDVFFPVKEKPGPLVGAGVENVKRAQQMLDRVEAAGGTNIAEAMQTALAALAGGGSDRPKYLFLTDGIPTVGLTEEKDILREIKKANTCNARVFAFGVGYDVNVQLLERLINDNNGRSEYVKPAEPIEAKVSSLYNKVKNPVMTDLTLSIRDLGLKDMYPRKLGDLFDGDQIVVVGRYDAGDMKKLPPVGGGFLGQLTIKGRYEGAERAFEYPVTINPAGKDIRFAFVEKLWAMRRVGYLLDEISLNGSKTELVEEVTRLGIKYGIMTPYTSFLADERTNLTAGPSNAMKAGEAINRDFLRQRTGGDAQRGISNMQELARAKKAPGDAPAELGAFKKDAEGHEVFTAGGSVMVGHASTEDYEGDKIRSLDSVRNVGQQAVYRREQRRGPPVWIASNASDIDPDRDQAKIREITRFSEEYFKLTQGNSADENRVLASQQADEELVMRMQGQVYHVK
ncbi:MAG: VWA domain-containing protein, partial [Planctomycetota bacterium]|nr:VWA domain-containing protein [Planctomycetota bacterium]